MRYNIPVFALTCFLILGCNDQKEEPKSSDPVATERAEGKEGETSSNPMEFLIGKKSAGNFKIGAPIPNSLEDFSVTKEQQMRTTEEGPTEETVYIIREGNEEIMKILPAIDTNTGETTEDIGEMRITSEKYRTEEGIGVNSTLEEFIAAYPNYKIWYTYVSDMYVIEAEEVEAQFLLKEKDFTGSIKVNSVMTPLNKEDFKEGARVAMVRIIQ